MPAEGDLLVGEPPLALLEDLSLTVRLSPNRIMPAQELDREEVAAGELHIMTAVCEHDIGGARLPALSLDPVILRRLLPSDEVRPRIRPCREAVIDGRKVEQAELDCVVAEFVGPAGPRRGAMHRATAARGSRLRRGACTSRHQARRQAPPSAREADATNVEVHVSSLGGKVSVPIKPRPSHALARSSVASVDMLSIK